MGVGNIYKVVVQGLYAGQNMINVLHYRVSSVAGLGDSGTDLAAQADATLGNLWKQQLTEVANYVQCTAQKISPDDPFVPVSNGNSAGNGVRDQPGLPPADSIVITKRTAFAGRGFRGRVFLWGLCSTDFLNGAFDGAYPAAYGNLADGLALPLTTLVAQYVPGIYRTPDPTADPPITERFTPLTSCEVRIILRSQRRRQVGVGI